MDVLPKLILLKADATAGFVQKTLGEFRFNEAVGAKAMGGLISFGDSYVNNEKPWELAKTNPSRLPEVLYYLLESLRHIAVMLIPFMPETADKILDQLGVLNETKKTPLEHLKQWGALKQGTLIKKTNNLFPRL